MKIQNVKGGYDFLPEEQKIRDYINSVIIKNFKAFGFKSIETPILCYYDILADKYDENNDILKEIYRLKDQGDRDLGLRYDLTVPFAKFIAINKKELAFPFKRYEISKVFRDGPVKVGRDREFTQCDADIVGISGEYIEAELLSLYVKTFKELNIDIYIKYNSRKLMTGLIKEVNVPDDLISSITTIIDKKDKLPKIEFDDMLISIGLESTQIEKLNEYFQMDFKELLKKFKETNNDNIKEGLEETKTLEESLKELGIDSICKFDSTLARGQNYYTGNVFEVYDKEKRVTGSIGAGGRYDKMIGNFINDGNEYPAVGISFGLTSIYEILKDEVKNRVSNTDVYIIPMETEKECLKLASIIRNNDYNVEIEFNKRKLKKSLDYANKEGIKYVIIVGSNELANKKVTIKNMLNATNEEININDLNTYEFK